MQADEKENRINLPGKYEGNWLELTAPHVVIHSILSGIKAFHLSCYPVSFLWHSFNTDACLFNSLI